MAAVVVFGIVARWHEDEKSDKWDLWQVTEPKPPHSCMIDILVFGIGDDNISVVPF